MKQTDFRGSSDELAEQMLEIPGQTMAFEITRDDAMTLARQQGTTFSREALEQVADHMKMWLFSRCFRELGTAGPMLRPTHKKLRALVTILVARPMERARSAVRAFATGRSARSGPGGSVVVVASPSPVVAIPFRRPTKIAPRYGIAPRQVRRIRQGARWATAA